MTLETAIVEYKSTWILTNEMRKVLRREWVINWLWPIHISKWASVLIDALKKALIKEWASDFEADADYHDLNYYIWWTEEDRLSADIWYFTRLSKDILKLNIPKFRGIYYMLLLYLSYMWVRQYGKLFFNYSLYESKKKDA